MEESVNLIKEIRMKKNGFLHPQLSKAIASLGHHDILWISDGNHPSPDDGRRIDLAIIPGLPDLPPVLSALKDELFIEEVILAAEMEEYNPKLYKWIVENFKDIPIKKLPHSPDLLSLKAEAKYIVRTASMSPWGNIVFVIGCNWNLILKQDGVRIPNEFLPEKFRK